MANVKVSALASLSALAENDTLIVNDYSEATEKVKAANVADLRLAMLLPGVDNTNDIGSAIKRVKDVYVAGDVTIGDDLTVTGDITVNSILQGKDVTVALHRKKIDIGAWNMDSTSSVSIAHGLTSTKIVSTSILIFNDTGVQLLPLTHIGGATFYVTDTYVVISRYDGYHFDSTSYDSGINRGFIVIDYID